MRKCQGSKAKTTDRTQTTNTIEDQATMIEETITNLQWDTESNKISKDSQGNKTIRNTIKNMIIADTNKTSRISDREETILEVIKDQIITKTETMIKDKTKEITRDNIMKEGQIETINRIKIKIFQKNTKEMTFKLKDISANKRRLISLTHLWASGAHHKISMITLIQKNSNSQKQESSNKENKQKSNRKQSRQ